MNKYDYDYDVAALVMSDKAGYYVCAFLGLALAVASLGLLGVV